MKHAFIILLFLLASCSEQTDDLSNQEDSQVRTLNSEDGVTGAPIQETNSLDTFTSATKAHCNTLVEANDELKTDIASFLDKPDSQTLEVALVSWERAHSLYGSLAILRKATSVSASTISSSEDIPLISHPLHIRIDQFPILPGYLDSVNNYPLSGLIHSDIELSEPSLNQEHQFSDAAYVTLGFHALKFMLEGDPELGLSPEQRFLISPPETPQSEEVPEQENPQLRRRLYVSTLTEILENDILAFCQAWDSEEKVLHNLNVKDAAQFDAALLTLLEEEKQVLANGSNEHDNADIVNMRQSFLSELTRAIYGQEALPASLNQVSKSG